MDEFDVLFKMRTGKTLDELTRISSPEETIARKRKEVQSRFPLRGIGWASDGFATLAEEERGHTHILGLPGQGKSKFLELLIRGDIDNLVARRSKAGLCLIDSSDFGNTYYKILRYCVQVGYQKVCLIDPNDLFKAEFGKVATINPIHYRAPVDVVAENVLEVMRILWDADNWTQTAKIQDYLEAVLAILHETEATLFEARYFRSRKRNDLYIQKRDEILSRIRYRQFSDAATIIDEVFSYNDNLFVNEFGSTMRRLRPLFSKTLSLITGSNASPLNFQTMIAEGWVILCNLDPLIWGVPQQKFLGTLVINELIYATYRLKAAGREIPYYLYIDEVGRYATRMLADVISYKRTSRIQLIMAHQDFSQIKNAEVLAAVRNAPIKVLFYVERDDREKVVRQMFGGDVPLNQAVWEVGKLQKQEAYIRVGKQNPRKTLIKNLPDPNVSDARVNAFKRQIYQNDWYRTKREIYDEINARFKPTQSSSVLKKRHSAKGPVEATRGRRGKGKDSDGAAARTVSDNRPDGAAVLFGKKGRATRKVNPNPPQEDR